MAKHLVFICLAVMFFTSCDEHMVFEEYKSLPDEWDRDSIVKFEVNNLDSIQPYDLFINLRNTNAYKFSNIFLISRINFPNGRVIQDTLEYDMAHSDGAWMGEGIGESKTSKLWYKEHVRFSERGAYTVEIRQAMRKNGKEKGIKNLKGITEVGLRIEQTKQTNSEQSE